MESLSVTLGARIHAGLARTLERLGFDAYAELVANESEEGTTTPPPPLREIKVRIKKGLYTLDMLRMSLCEVRGGLGEGN